MRPLDVDIQVRILTDDPAEVLRAREKLASILGEMDGWLELAAPRKGTQSRPAPLSAETPGDRANAGIVGDSLESAIAAAGCPCPKCTAKRARLNTDPIPPDYDTEPKADAPTSKELLAAVKNLARIMEGIA